MPLPFRTATLGAAHCSGGVRIYSRTPDGFVRELCNDTTEAQLNDALRAKNLDVVNHYNGWYPGELMFQSSPDSALCSYAWAAWSQSVLYQDASGALREWRHGNRWEQTQFVQENCLVGTNIAAVYSTGGAQAVLFFQDKDGYVCSRSANHWNWEPAKRIARAVRGTGIGATATDDLKDIRLFFQDEHGILCEYKGAFGAELKHDPKGFSKNYDYEIGDITAISWDNNAQIRVYMQNKENTIIEHVCDGGKWLPNLGNFKYNGLPDTDIIAYVRNAGSKHGFCVMVIWTGSDQELYQSVWSPVQGNWSVPKSIASVRGIGEMAGSWLGDQHFKEAQADTRSIHYVRICTVNKVIAGIQVEYGGIDDPQWHGFGDGKGTIDVLQLESGVDIVEVWYAEDPDHKRVTGLRFRTTDNVISPWYGSTGSDSNVWTRGGHALAGFQGCCAGGVITGLAPIWSTRMCGLTEKQIADLEGTAKALTSAATLAQQRYDALYARITKCPDEAQKMLGKPISAAVTALVDMAQHVECLYDQSNNLSNARLKGLAARRAYVDAEVQACRQSAQALAAAFASVSKVCHEDLRPAFNKLLDSINQCNEDTKNANKALHKFYTAVLVTSKSLHSTVALINGRERVFALAEAKKAEDEVEKKIEETRTAKQTGIVRAAENAKKQEELAKAAKISADEYVKSVEKMLSKLNASTKTMDGLKLAASQGVASAAKTQTAIDKLVGAGNDTDEYLDTLIAGVDAVVGATAVLADPKLAAPKPFAVALRGVLGAVKQVDLLAFMLAGDPDADLALIETTVEQIASA